MARDRDNLLRGQGLLRQGITGASNRWKTYAKIFACTVAAEPSPCSKFSQAVDPPL
jgi:hypothetical protein